MLLQAGRRPFLVMLAVAAGLRLLLFGLVEPIVEPDTASYVDLAQKLVQGDLAGIDGLRTPGYPLFLLLGFLSPRVVVAYQIGLGLAVVWLMLTLGERLGLPLRWNLAAAAVYAFFVQFVVYEFFLMSEALTIFLVTAAWWLFMEMLTREEARTRGRVFLMMLLAALAAWTRPIYLLLPGYLLLMAHMYLPGAWNAGCRQAIRFSVVGLAPVVILAGSWCLVNAAYGRGFTYATGRGFGLLELMGDYLETPPAREPEATISRLYLAARERNLAAGRPHEDTIWEVLGELREATGLSVKELSDHTWNMAVRIIKEQPRDYLKQVALSWWRFWLPPGQRMLHPYGDFFRGLPPEWAAVMVGAIKTLTVAQRKFLGLLELLFLAAPLSLAWTTCRARIGRELMISLMVLWVFILGKSLAIAFIEGGEGRFALPTFPTLISLTFAFYYRLIVAPLPGR